MPYEGPNAYIEVEKPEGLAPYFKVLRKSDKVLVGRFFAEKPEEAQAAYDAAKAFADVYVEVPAEPEYDDEEGKKAFEEMQKILG